MFTIIRYDLFLWHKMLKTVHMKCTFSHELFIVIIIIRVFCPRAGPSLQVQKPSLQFCRRQVFHQRLRNQCCSFTRDWIGAVASRCFLHPTISSASEKISGCQVDVRRVDADNWALQTSPKFTTIIKYQFNQGVWSDQRSGNPNHPSPPPIYSRELKFLQVNYESFDFYLTQGFYIHVFSE